MHPLVTYPDPVKAAIDYLRLHLTGVAVGARVPNPRPIPFVHVRRAGGVESGPVTDQPRIDVQVWHNSEFDAADLADHARYLLLGAVGRMPSAVSASTFLGPTPVPDPESAQARYLFTVEIGMRGVTA